MTSEKVETSSVTECSISESNFGFQLWCCLATKNKDGTFTRCKRFACMRTKLTKRLIKVAVSKRLPLLHNKEISHNFLCFFHAKIIVEEREFDDDFYERDFSSYEQNEAEEYSPPSKRRRKSDAISISSDEEICADEPATSGESSKSSKKPSDDKQNDDPLLEGADFSNLSSVAIRRYKKFFKLPNRSGANSKQQLLDGIEEHFKNLPVDVSETVAFFMYTVKSKRNKLDHPNEELGPRNKLRSET